MPEVSEREVLLVVQIIVEAVDVVQVGALTEMRLALVLRAAISRSMEMSSSGSMAIQFSLVETAKLRQLGIRGRLQ